jgi:ATP-dependent Lon protease
LIPKIKKEMSVGHLDVEFSEETIIRLIRDYTREAGVRELERKLTAIYRRITLKEVTRKKHRTYKLKPTDIAGLIGAPVYQYDEVPETAAPGYAIGLAWTETGGELLPIEVALVSGSNKLTMTGKLGEVMQESATAALTYIRANAERFDIDHKLINDNEIHVHVPEGAIPKEGPSAGITMIVAMLSALKDIPVTTKIAMTGEISLTGDIIPVGGLNEKLLAAKRVGINDIVLPFKNSKEISELPKQLVRGLKLRKVKKVDEALRAIFGPGIFKRGSGGRSKKPVAKKTPKTKAAKRGGKKKK